jgi:hypothetical protein
MSVNGSGLRRKRRENRRSLIKTAKRSHNFRRQHDPSLKALQPGGKILSNGDVELTQVDNSTAVYKVAPVVGWRVTPAAAPAPVFTRVVQAVKASLAEAMAAAELPAGSKVDVLPIYRTVNVALGRKTNNAAIWNTARAAVDLAVERYLDIVTTPSPVAAE